MIRVLVTGAGGSPAVNFTRSLKNYGVSPTCFLVGVDADPFYVHRSECDINLLVPKVSDTNYIAVINNIIAEYEIDFVHVQNDVEMAFVSENRERINAKTFLPSKETVRTCQDKLATYKLWSAVGLPQPATMLLNNGDDLADALALFGGHIWIRDTTGAGGRGSLKVNDYATGFAWMNFKKGWGKYTAAQLLSERSVTWQSIWNKGTLVCAQGRERLYWELNKISPSGITGATGAGKTISDPTVDDIAMKAILAVDHEPHGIFSVDLTYDFNGVPNPTEINIGRFFTTHEFFSALGLNMPKILLSLAFEDHSKQEAPLINPLESGWIWIRGMDFEPILIHERDMKLKQAALDTKLKELL